MTLFYLVHHLLWFYCTNWWIVSWCVNLFTVYLPTSPIRRLSIDDVDWNSAELSWLPPHNYSEPTAVYKIQCTTNGYDIVYETSQTATRLGNLLENTQYECKVFAGAKNFGYFEKGIDAKFRTLGKFDLEYIWSNMILVKGKISYTRNKSAIICSLK